MEIWDNKWIAYTMLRQWYTASPSVCCIFPYRFVLLLLLQSMEYIRRKENNKRTMLTWTIFPDRDSQNDASTGRKFPQQNTICFVWHFIFGKKLRIIYSNFVKMTCFTTSVEFANGMREKNSQSQYLVRSLAAWNDKRIIFSFEQWNEPES